MDWFSSGVALLVAIGIIAIGIMYLVSPRAATESFGLPLPEEGPNVAWWLRLKGSRDVTSGLVVLALMAWSTPRMVGVVLLIEAIIPVSDMSLIFAAKGSAKRALSIHGLTAALMVLAAIPLILGAA